MTDSILRLKVDSQEYDAKLKRAAQGLQHYADGCRKVGGTLEVVEQDTLDFVKAVGQMETVSNTAKGKLNELTHAFTELSVQYKQLTDGEKQSPFGQALASSLDQLKGRIQDSKNQLDDVTKTLNGSGGLTGALESLAGKFGLNIKQLTGFGAVLGASKLALDAAKDAFFSSETNVDDWGRTVAESEAIYESFVQALNTGNFSGFLTNIGQVTQAAKDAYNALDELGTRMTIINPERAKLQAEQQRLRATIRREGANSEVGKQATAQLRALEPKLAKSYTTESKMNYNAFEKLVRERLAVGGINLNQKSFDQFMKTFSSDDAFNRLKANARGKVTAEYTSGGRNEEGQVSRVDTRNTEQKLLDLFTDKWRQQNSAYLTAAFNAQGASFTNQLGNSRYLRTQSVGGGGGGRTGGTTTQTDEERAAKRMADAQHKYELSLEKAKAELDSGTITEAEFKKVQKRAAESLFEAADDAYQTFADPQYKAVKDDAKQKFVALGGEIKTLTETEKANQQRARELEAAQKKLTESERKMAEALQRGNLGDYLKAQKEVVANKANVDRLQQLPTANAIATQRTITVQVDSKDALKQLLAVNGAKVDPKSVKVTADTEDATDKLADIEDTELDQKDVAVTVDTAESLEKLADIEDTELDTKNVIVTITDANVISELEKINGIQIKDKNFTVTPTIKEAIPAIATQRTITVQVDSKDALKQLLAVNGAKVDPKSVKVTADTEDATDKLADIEDTELDQKDVAVTVDTAESLEKLADIEDTELDTKNVIVTITDANVISELEKINGIQIKDKSFTVNFPFNEDNLNAFIENIKKRMSEADFGSELWSNLTKQLADANALSSLMDSAKQAGLDPSKFGLDELFKKLFNINPGDYISDREVKDTSNKLRKAGARNTNIDPQTGKPVKDKDRSFVDVAGQLQGGVSSMVNSLEQLGIQIPEGFKGIMSGISSTLGVLQAIAMIVEAIEAMQTVGTFLGIFKTGGIAHAAQGFVPGNNYSDNVPLMVSSGELILNRAQQGNIASQLSGSTLGDLNLSAIICGEQIRLVLNNNGRRTGRGEYVQTNRR